MSDDKPSQGLYLLTIGVMLLGTLLFILGTRDDGGAHANERQRTSRLGEVGQPLSKTTELAVRGAALQQLKCAGCHAGNRREIGPSYALIAEHYRSRPDELSAAMEHPGQSWGDYPPNPAGPPLTRDDQAALVYWILSRGVAGDE
jgi:cytochrome c551/c552